MSLSEFETDFTIYSSSDSLILNNLKLISIETYLIALQTDQIEFHFDSYNITWGNWFITNQVLMTQNIRRKSKVLSLHLRCYLYDFFQISDILSFKEHRSFKRNFILLLS